MTRQKPAMQAGALLDRIDAAIAELMAIRAAIVPESKPNFRFNLGPIGAECSGPIAAWMAERCVLSDAAQSSPSLDLYDDFGAWCVQRGAGSICTRTAFGRALRASRLASCKDGAGRRRWRGIQLRTAPSRGLGDAASVGL